SSGPSDPIRASNPPRTFTWRRPTGQPTLCPDMRPIGAAGVFLQALNARGGLDSKNKCLVHIIQALRSHPTVYTGAAQMPGVGSMSRVPANEFGMTYRPLSALVSAKDLIVRMYRLVVGVTRERALRKIERYSTVPATSFSRLDRDVM